MLQKVIIIFLVNIKILNKKIVEKCNIIKFINKDFLNIK